MSLLSPISPGMFAPTSSPSRSPRTATPDATTTRARPPARRGAGRLPLGRRAQGLGLERCAAARLRDGCRLVARHGRRRGRRRRSARCRSAWRVHRATTCRPARHEAGRPRPRLDARQRAGPRGRLRADRARRRRRARRTRPRSTATAVESLPPQIDELTLVVPAGSDDVGRASGRRAWRRHRRGEQSRSAPGAAIQQRRLAGGARRRGLRDRARSSDSS